MSDRITVYEAGVRGENGKYTLFVKSNVRAEVDDYIEIMKDTVSECLEIVYFEKSYDLISTTPYIIERNCDLA